MSEYIELASDTEMISCWVAENNGWKYACHNTVPEQSRLIHICQDSQAASLFVSWDCAVVYLLAGENFLESDDKGRAMALECTLPYCRYTHMCQELFSPLLPQVHHMQYQMQCAAGWQHTVTCQGVVLGCGGRERQGKAGKGRERQLLLHVFWRHRSG